MEKDQLTPEHLDVIDRISYKDLRRITKEFISESKGITTQSCFVIMEATYKKGYNKGFFVAMLVAIGALFVLQLVVGK